MRIGARRRLLLTGTPLQNNLLGTVNHQWYFQLFVRINSDFGQNSEKNHIEINSELISLLKFIMPDLLQKSSATLNKIFKLRNSESDFAKQRVKEAKTILQVLPLFSKINFLISYYCSRSFYEELNLMFYAIFRLKSRKILLYRWLRSNLCFTPKLETAFEKVWATEFRASKRPEKESF